MRRQKASRGSHAAVRRKRRDDVIDEGVGTGTRRRREVVKEGIRGSLTRRSAEGELMLGPAVGGKAFPQEVGIGRHQGVVYDVPEEQLSAGLETDERSSARQTVTIVSRRQVADCMRGVEISHVHKRNR